MATKAKAFEQRLIMKDGVKNHSLATSYKQCG